MATHLLRPETDPTPRRLWKVKPPAQTTTLAEPTFTAGWASFGLPLAQGELPGGQSLKVDEMDTQTDVKTTYSDGSARFAVVTCQPTMTMQKTITRGDPASGSFTPTVPTASVALAVQERFKVLGTYTITSGTLKVTLANDGSARVVAGAVRINPDGDPNNATIINAGDAGYSTAGTWTALSNTGYKQQGVEYADGTDGSNVATWTFTGLDSGDYRVAVQWTDYTVHNFGHATNASYSVYDNAALEETVTAIRHDRRTPGDIEDKVTFTATLPSGVNTSDRWLNGPLVQEWRRKVTPVDGGAVEHPWLRVIFDCRVYNDDSGRLTVCVENCLNVALATAVWYDVEVTVNGSSAFTQADFLHLVCTRWGKNFTFGSLTESTITEDWEPFHRSKALPRFESSTSNTRFRINGGNINEQLGQWGIGLRGGLSSNQMDQASSRAELGFFPDWVASYVVHKGEQKDWLVQSAYHAASNPIHVRESDGSMWLSSTHPDFWLDDRGKEGGAAGDQPKMNLHNGHQNVEGDPLNPIYADRAHQPSFIFPGYILTGDRFLHDQMRDWALFCLYSLPNGHRNGTDLLQQDTAVRAMAWPLRNMAEARAFLADGDGAATELSTSLTNSLAWYDDYAAGTQAWTVGSGKVLTMALDGGGEYGATWEDHQVGDGFNAYAGQVGLWAHWQQAFMVYAIRRVNDLGFTGGLDLLDRMAGFMARLHDEDPDWPESDAVTYYPMFGSESGGTYTMDETIADAYQRNVARAALGSTEQGQMGWPWDRDSVSPQNSTWPAYAGPHRAVARIAVERSLPHASVAKTALESYVTSTGNIQDSYNLQDPWY